MSELTAASSANEVIEGIRLSEATLPSRTAALRDSLGLVGKPPQEVYALIRTMPQAEAAGLEAFFTAVTRFSPLVADAIGSIDKMAAAQQRARVQISVEESPEKASKTPRERVSVPIDRSKIVVVTKLSKLQYDMHRFRLNEREVAEMYQKGGENPEKIFKSHERQQESLAELKRILPEATYVGRVELTGEKIKDAQLVIALGGDNHLQYVAHFIHGQTPLLGCNSDPLTSTGALLDCSTKNIEETLGRLEKGEYRFEAWPKMKVTVDGTELPLAISDLFIGETERKYMSRHTIEIDGRRPDGPMFPDKEKGLEQKSSGMLVTTGAGSSSWYKSAGRYIYPEGHQFPRSSPYLRFLLTEVSASVIGSDGEGSGQRVVFPPMAEGALYEGERLVIRSLNDSKGIIAADSLEEVDFNRGKTATIEISPEPLWTVRL